MKTLHLECQSGICGDMTVAALLDLGGSEHALRTGLASLGVDGYTLGIERVSKSGIDACDFDVQLQDHHIHPATVSNVSAPSPHSHIYPDDLQDGDGNHAHSHDHNHDHDHHTHPLDEHHHHGLASEHGSEHHHRNLSDILSLIDASEISPPAKAIASRIFTIVAQAEGTVHGLPAEEVHFHEVGAVDSIVDIVGAAILLDDLEIERVICTGLREGCGTVRCQHGVMPVPAPATLEILRTHTIPFTPTDLPGELITPTGAAILAAVADSFSLPDALRVLSVGYGAGKRNYPHTANLLRASLIETVQPEQDEVLKLECNLDDMTGEELAFAAEKLFSAGALDVWFTPILMKKGRPAQMLSILIPPNLEEEISNLVFTHTSTLGLRTSRHPRHIMARKSKQIETPCGKILVKESSRGKICKIKLEHESVKSIANAQNLSINQISRCAYSRLDD